MTEMMRRFAVLASLSFLVLGLSAGLAEEPRAQVSRLLDAIRKVKEPEQRQAAVAQANSTLDIAGLCQKSLGKQWKALDESAQKEFVSLLTRVFEVRAYPKSSKFFKELEVKYGDQEIDEDRAVVRTTVMHPDEGQVDLDYKLRKTDGGGWVIYEVDMDEVGMAANLRSQIRKVVKKDGHEELFRRLREKIKEAEKEGEGGEDAKGGED